MNNKLNPVLDKTYFDGKDILEIGCGYGCFTMEYLTGAKSILGIDNDVDAIEYIRKHWPTSNEESYFIFRVGDIKDFALQNKEFDIAIFSSSF